MSLDVKLHGITKLRGKADRFCTLTFRGIPLNSVVLTGVCQEAYFSEDFYWPLETILDKDEYIEVKLFNRNKIFQDRIVGAFRFSLLSICQGGMAEVRERMIDSNHNVLQAEIRMDIIYTPPGADKAYYDLDAKSQSVVSITPSQAAAAAPAESGFGFEDVDADLLENIEDVYHPKIKHPKLVNVEVQDWIMNIRVIEARDLAGVNLNPFVTVTVGGDLETQRKTKVKKQTCNPEWDELFVFDNVSSKEMMMDKIVLFEVYNKGGLLSEDNLIGSFKCDVWYIHDAVDSSIFSRFAPLLDGYTTEMKGYLRLDLQVFGRGDVVKDPPPRKEDADIEQNLILPPKINPFRSVNQYQIKVYAAEGIPQMNSSYAYMANVRMAISKKKLDLADPFIKISFAGVEACTKVVKNSYAPQFNEQISFTEFFPPLCKRIKIELFDKDFNGEEIIGTHFLDLAEISNPGDSKAGGFMPVFGPCWIHLYGGIRDYGSPEEYIELSHGMGEGVAYRGRILLWLDCIESEPSDTGIVAIEDSDPIPPNIVGKEQIFQLFATFYEASMIPCSVGGKERGLIPGSIKGHTIQFEIAIGEHGFATEDEMKKAEKAKNVGKDQVEEEDDQDAIYQEEKVYVSSITPPIVAECSNSKYFHVPFGSDKPNVHIKFPMEDQRRRHYNTILLNKIEAVLEENLEEVDERYRLRYPRTHKLLQRALGEVVHNCTLFMDLTDGKKTGTHLGKNRLDKERDKLCSLEVKQVSLIAANIAKTCDVIDDIEEKIKKTRNLLSKVKKIVREPQGGLPDIFVWMIVENKRVAYARLPAEDFLYSQVPTERGEYCGRVHTMFLRLPGKLGHGNAGWAIQAKVEIRIWLGLLKHKSEYLRDAPSGYMVEENACSKLTVPPPYLHYTVKQKFVLRAHIYQARSLIGSDDSGLSDAFLRCVFGHVPLDTYVVWETRSPTWDVMLKFDNVEMWGDVTEFTVNPPTIVLEVFDLDPGGEEEFIGRALAKPIIKLAEERYEKPFFPPALQWFPIYRGESKSGDLLAAFEMLHVDDNSLTILPEDPPITEHEQGPLMQVPDNVRPVMQKHRVEVLFWGVRDIQKVQYMRVNRPIAELDCCYKVERLEEPGLEVEVLRSTMIANTKRNPNFHDSVDIFDIWMPEKEKYLPPMQVKVLDCRAFGRRVLCGTSVVESMHEFFMDPNLFESREPEVEDLGKRAGAEDPGGDDIPDPEEEAPVEKKEKKKNKGEEEEEVEVLDWWTRFYATLRDMEEAEEARRIAELEAAGVVVKKRKLPFSLPGRKKDDTPEEPAAVPGADIPRLTVYMDELENIPEFGGFRDFMISFDLMRGKRIDEDDYADHRRRYSGKFKGNVRVWEFPLPPGFENLDDMGSFYKLPSHDPLSLLVRVYIIRGLNLHPMDANGKADPYVVCGLGKKTNKMKEDYCSKTLEPEFGQCHEFKALIPFDYMVRVALYDWDMLGGDDLIGETFVDIENLFYSKHRPKCGIQKDYIPHGYAQWRDPEKPSSILTKLCKEFYIDGPDFGESVDDEGNVKAVCTVGGKEFFADPFFKDENGKESTSDEPCALVALHNFQELAPKGFHLCPEYVETRSLFNDGKPGIEMGKVQMWIDMFPMDLAMPGDPVNIAVRKPDEYELRVVIWNTEDVLCDETNLSGEATSDIFIKAWLEGTEEDRQSTDVHYSARDGTGLFNWRMIFPFKFHKAEEKFVTFKKETLFSVDLTMQKHKPLIYIQAWDADLFSADDFIGDVIMKLTRLPCGAKSPSACNLDMLKPGAPTVDFFKLKKCKGWWPVQAIDDDDDAKLGKDGKPEPILAGKIEIEFDLLTKEDAEADPAGKKRNEPQPLEKPNRPSRFQFVGPLTLLRYMIWEPCKWNLLKLVLCLLAILLIALFLYSMPGYTIKKLFGA